MPVLPDAVASPLKSPKRFEPARSTLLFDRFMTGFIKLGGILVIAAVLGIFVFIFSQILPLFRGADVEPLASHTLLQKDYKIIGIDEWSELPFFVEPDGSLSFVDLARGRPVQVADLGFPEGTSIQAVRYIPQSQLLVYGTGAGQFSIVDLNYERTWEKGQDRVTATPSASPLHPIGPAGGRVVRIAYGDSGKEKLAAAVIEMPEGAQVHATTLTQSRSLLGAGKVGVGEQFDLTPSVEGQPQRILVNSEADGILISTGDGEILYFFRKGKELILRQKFAPFADLEDASIASMDFLLGEVSIVVTNHAGANRIFSLFVPPDGNDRLFGQTKEFKPLPAGATLYFPSQRNKSFLIGTPGHISLRYGTTEAIRWESETDFRTVHGVLSGKQDRILLLDEKSELHVFRLHDPHPEASFKGLFGKVWYEGAAEPKFEWQSTGGTDDFEPKLSLVPLIVGTLKGTLYAMLFAVPIGLLAALYTAEFLAPKIRRTVKPMMEIMASLPSVVLGFLAALWLAPLIDTRVPSVMLLVIMIPGVAMLTGWGWSLLPPKIRLYVPRGWEFAAFLPLLLLTGWVAWHLGPVLERAVFTVKDPATGQVIADFRRWWPEVTGTPFEQRNSLVVGFMMGFAVIPIIFTIAEDSLSNVPGALRSGSLALGASRWQTAIHVVLPTASAGIFSALMIGLGRAVGETMIVVMATGNTPIMDFNIFSGMRTLSANIAVELPEAPHHGTLYRTLFLGAMVLFLLTFAVNTVAEILRQHLREKYKTV